MKRATIMIVCCWMIVTGLTLTTGGARRKTGSATGKVSTKPASRPSPSKTPETCCSRPSGAGGAPKLQLSLKPSDVANHKGDGPDGKGNTVDDTWRFWFQLIHARKEYRPLDIATAAMSPGQRAKGIRRKVRGPIGSMTPNPKQTEGWIYHSDWDGRFEGFWGDKKTGQVLAHPYNEKTSGGAVAVTCRIPENGTYRICGKITDVNVAKIKHRALTGVKWSLDVVAPRGPNAIVGVLKALGRGGPVGDTLGPASAKFSVERVVLKKGNLIRLVIDPNKSWGGDMTRIDYFNIERIAAPKHRSSK